MPGGGWEGRGLGSTVTALPWLAAPTTVTAEVLNEEKPGTPMSRTLTVLKSCCFSNEEPGKPLRRAGVSEHTKSSLEGEIKKEKHVAEELIAISHL